MAFERIEDPHYKELVIANQAWKMTESPPRVKWACRPVGADNEYIYNLKLGLGLEQLTKKREKGIV
jgi:crotonobetainyl-CoA:carnitine CoA-transferase CaiB-like acyl-CoA transferase